MFERTVSREDLDRLYREREAADRAYNDALTRIDEAIRPLREPPAAAPATPVEEPPALADPGDVSLSNRGSPAPGWRRWVRRLIAPVVDPALQRQTAFNRTLVEHLARLAAARRGEREAMERLAAFLREEAGALAAFQSRLVQYAQQVTPYVDTKDREVAGLMRRISEDNTVQVEALALRVDGAGAGLEAVSAAQRALDESFALLEASARVLKRELHRLRSAPVVSADPDRSAGPEAAAPVVAPLAEDDAAEDDGSAYVGFEDVFRGRHDDIVERQRSYLPYFEGATDVLDLGCGRGEFLELLRERGIAARGIDTNAEMVARCVERGLAVTRSDALSHLRALPDASVGGLFSAQVVEHLGPRYLMRLLEAMHRVLRPGGRAVVETINPAVLDGVLQRLSAGRDPPSTAASGHAAASATGRRIRRNRGRVPLTHPRGRPAAAHPGRPDPGRHPDRGRPLRLGRSLQPERRPAERTDVRGSGLRRNRDPTGLTRDEDSPGSRDDA